uniref:Coiled-coil domain containing 141 n=1 Tax=Sinocyclocheilus grahami TaxID=75366 RepID=A0A672QCH1_SINGR
MCGELVHLQLTEAQPNLLEIGNNQDETKKLLEEHEQLLAKLKKNEGGVWALLEEADKTAAQKEGEELVYEAMAVSLSEAWKTLVAHLEKRRSLLILACRFFECALEFAIRIDEAEDFQSVGQKSTTADNMNELLQRHTCALSSGMLEKSMLVLNKSRELLGFLKDFQSQQALKYDRASHGAWSSFGKVEGLMEILQDRRRQVDLCMRQQKHELETIYRIRQWESQEQEVSHSCKEKFIYYRNWMYCVLKLQSVTFFFLLKMIRNQYLSKYITSHEKLKATHKHFWSLMMNRLAHLQESNAFYSSAKKAFEVLGTIEIAIKELRNQLLPLPELARKHDEYSRSIKDASVEPLQRGQLLLQNAQVGGLQRMLGYIKERIDALSHECHAHRELTGKRQQLVSSFEELVDKCSAFTHPKCTHTAVNTHTHTVNTHPEQWAAIYAAAPGEQLGVRCLAQGHLSHGIEGRRERCTFTPPTYNPCRYETRTHNLLGYESGSLTISPRLPLMP